MKQTFIGVAILCMALTFGSCKSDDPKDILKDLTEQVKDADSKEELQKVVLSGLQYIDKFKNIEQEMSEDEKAEIQKLSVEYAEEVAKKQLEFEKE